jgi:hypothetical protein
MGICRCAADQFPAGGEAFPLPIFVHQRQTPVTVAPNPMRLLRRPERQGQANFQHAEFDVTMHRLKPNPGDGASLAANCPSLRISCRTDTPPFQKSSSGTRRGSLHEILLSQEVISLALCDSPKRRLRWNRRGIFEERFYQRDGRRRQHADSLPAGCAKRGEGAWTHRIRSAAFGLRDSNQGMIECTISEVLA